LIFGVLLLLLLSGVLTFSSFRNQRFKIRTLEAEADAAEQRALNQQKRTEIQNILQDAELKALRLSMETQQRERSRIASNLHDRLGSKLSVVQWLFQSLVKYTSSMPENVQEKYGKGITYIEEACTEVRDIARNMQSGDLAHFGLQMALERFCDQVRLSCDLSIQFTAFGSPRKLSAELEGEIYATIRTLIENVLRHAGARQCSIQLHYQAETLQIMIEDNGKGFDVAVIAQGPGIGLKNVKQRVENLEGTFSVESKPNAGTLVAITFPTQLHEYPL
jgi:two-component system NarL family sensor kinase